MYCLVVGNPVDGLRFFGPFEESSFAIDVAESIFRNEPWFLADLDDWQDEDVDDFETEANSQ